MKMTKKLGKTTLPISNHLYYEKKKNSFTNIEFKANRIAIPNNKYFNNSKLFNKINKKPEAILDLHGYSLYSGKITLQKYVINCYEKNIRSILIITGKGQNNKGVLKKEVPKWLDDNFFRKYLVNYMTAPNKLGGEGALLVRIKNKYKNYK